MLIKAGRIWLTTWKTCSRISEKNIKLFLVKYLCAAALTAYSNPSQHFMMVEVSEPHAPSASEASHTRKKPGYTHKHPEGLTSAGPTWNFARVFVEGQEGKHTYARV